MESLFFKLYNAQTELELHEIITSTPIFNTQDNWKPLGDMENNYSVVENQQSSPIAALVEKLTNSIDAILMKKSYENEINPKSAEAPQSMDKAVEIFYKDSYQNWNLPSFAKEQSKDIQIIADGPKRDTSLIVYDNGEGQHPEDFESTFLSLMRGNKNDIKFVQGKYNMGGTGALVFCGKYRYQLIASKKFDYSGKFGFTLIRKHPFTEEESQTKKNTWYEYFKINDEIASFDITDLDLGLHERLFKTGTIIKLFSYKLPPGNALISKDLNYSLNEFLIEPALPILTVEKEERYPNDRNRQRHFFGLKRRLEESKDYLQEYFSFEHDDQRMGKMNITCYVFNTRVKDKSVKETKTTIRNEFFKSNMVVPFSVNGQVHGFYTSEFITRTLKMHLLKDYLLIHVDCTEMKATFRSELFMASRDRLKDSEESRYLRNTLAKELGKSEVANIHKDRKNQISFDSDDTQDLLKNFTKNLPLNNELMNLLNKSFKLDEIKPSEKKEKKQSKSKQQKEKENFEPQRFPSFFKYHNSKKDGTNAVKIPQEGEKTLLFDTDVENHYFDRSEEPGDLKISILKPKNNDTTGGNDIGKPSDISESFNVTKSSPKNGKIKVILNPTKKMKVGDKVEIKIDLNSPSGSFEELIHIEIDQKQKEHKPKEEEKKEEQIGLPKYHLVKEENLEGESYLTWESIENIGKTMDIDTVMLPLTEDGETLSAIYINLDSKVLKNYRSKLKGLEERSFAEKKYIATTFFHTLFLYTITKNRKYSLQKENGEELLVDEYIEDLFQSYYASFLLNFDIGDLIDTIAD